VKREPESTAIGSGVVRSGLSPAWQGENREPYYCTKLLGSSYKNNRDKLYFNYMLFLLFCG